MSLFSAVCVKRAGAHIILCLKTVWGLCWCNSFLFVPRSSTGPVRQRFFDCVLARCAMGMLGCWKLKVREFTFQFVAFTWGCIFNFQSFVCDWQFYWRVETMLVGLPSLHTAMDSWKKIDCWKMSA